MAYDISRHPCFNDESRHEFGRIHLPVAPNCNIQCNFCNRDFDCVNESRPGVTSVILSPGQSLWYLKQAIEKDPRLSVVGIAGPGDPFANAEETMETLRLVRQEYPEMLLCVASNGLHIGPYIDELADLKVTHVTITVNAVDPDVGAKVYGWVRDKKKVYRGHEAAALLWERQREAIKRLVERDVLVKVNSIIIPDVNDQHIEKIADTVGAMGVTILNAIPIYPVANTPFEDVPQPSQEMVHEIRSACKPHVPLMHHCTRCRADAVGVLGEAASLDMVQTLRDAASLPLIPEQDRPYVAVASHEGMLVNQHLGEAQHLWIFQKTDVGYEQVELRPAPDRGGGDARWQQMARTISDCRALLAANAGKSPVNALEDAGVQVVLMEGLIDDALEAIYSGQIPRSPCRQGNCKECSGSGAGCG